MISIIVSTYKPENFAAFSKNVEQTIGIEYEIIDIQNPGIMGLCEAYNIGISKARFPYLCFSHDDIKINTRGWGEIIINQFRENKGTGIIAIAGDGYKPWVPIGWGGFLSNSMRVNISHNCQNELDKYYYNPQNKTLDDVLVVDGCWFCTTSEIANQHRFDEDTFRSYHYYDIDFSLRVSRNYHVFVFYGIDIEHYSRGNFSKDWVIDAFKFYNKWKKCLPISVMALSKDEIAKNEFHAFCYILEAVSRNKTGLWSMFRILYTFKLIRLVGLKKWIKLQKYTWTVALKKLTILSVQFYPGHN